jgi:putative two-component system response regulator
MRILIVDDDKYALALLRAVLESYGHEVVTAMNGRQALAMLRDGSYRMIVSDWDMPVMDGIELCRAIRSDETLGYVYIVLLTTFNGINETVEGLQAGADDFVSKPFNPSKLNARIQRAERILSIEKRDAMILAMAELAESRDPETGAHLDRVQCYSRVLAQHLAGIDKYRSQVTAEYIRLIYVTSPLHDIGKSRIPESILLKPAPLDEHEFEIMKTHAALGAQTLDGALRRFPGAEFLRMGRQVAASHHERFDGSGYPDWLDGESIPLCARIVAVADVYDALTSKRAYKEAFSHAAARSIIVAEAGRHFDPDLVDAFVQNESKLLSIRSQFNEPRRLAA